MSTSIPVEVDDVLRFPGKTVNETTISIASYRGPTRAQENEFPFEDYKEYPVIFNNADRIYDHILKGRSHSTLIVLRRGLNLIVEFLTWLKNYHGIAVSNVDDIDLNTSSMIYIFLVERLGNYKKISFFRRVLRTLGILEENIPLNTFLSTSTEVKDVVPIEVVVKMYIHFKREVEIIIDRSKEFDSLKLLGHDPRREHGGKSRDWQNLANRIYVILHVFGTEIQSVRGRRVDDGLRTAIAGLENHPGAMVLRVDGNHKRLKGPTGYLAYLYPSERDLLPFVALLLIKTRFNLAVIMGLRIGVYAFKPVSLIFGQSERVIQFAAPKYRTVQNADDEPNFVHCLSLIRPYAHPYQLIKFLERLTTPLRKEVKRKIKELKLKKFLNTSEKSYLDKLETIKDDLFLYYASGEIGSLGTFAKTGASPTVFGMALKNLDFPTSLGALRSAALAYGANMSGATESITQLLGDHKNKRSAKNYWNRKQLHNRWSALFVEVFELSMALIEANTFSKENLRLLLQRQGLSQKEINNLIETGHLTRWGNRCSDPYDPPPGFNVGTVDGRRCVGQACIDGCRRARWFPDALDLIQTERNNMLERLCNVGIAATAHSVIHDRITRCEKIISMILSRRSAGYVTP
ncbi:hypothetical protein [Rhizobium sp. Root1204]|uniref:hypothetical protein n=1 Tax=Rhizobium sp. Root1204 TaxID=1736428 RepID=UPI0012E35797|nr:hypothetical protein [Rhizobium sp. Root1204]